MPKLEIEYIAAVKNEVNLSDNYRKDLIESLARFSKYNNNKPFKDITRSNVIAFLESLCKTETTFSEFIYCDFSSGSIRKIQKIGSETDIRYNIMTAWFVMYTMGQSSPTYF